MFRVYYFKADVAVTRAEGANPIRLLGGSSGWFESTEIAIVASNLVNSGYCVFALDFRGLEAVDRIMEGLEGRVFSTGLMSL